MHFKDLRPYIFWVSSVVMNICIGVWALALEGLLVSFDKVNWLFSAAAVAFVISALAYLGLQSHEPSKLRSAGMYVSVFHAAMAWMLLDYHINKINYFPDTWQYLSVARNPVLSANFLLAIRAPILPLFLKIFGLSTFQGPSPELLLAARPFTEFQAVFSLFSSAILGVVLTRQIHGKAWRPVILFTFLAFGLTSHISMWEKILYAESISTSLLFLFIADLIVVDRFLSKDYVDKSLTAVIHLTVFGFLSILFAFTRDTNAYLLLGIATLYIAAVIIRGLRTNRWRIGRLMLASILLIVFLLSSYSARVGMRWLAPNLNVIHERILPDDDALKFFISNGLPYDENTNIFELDRLSFKNTVLGMPSGSSIYNWAVSGGLNTYYRYLLSHPADSLLQPVHDYRHLLTPDSREYQVTQVPQPTWIRVVDSVLYPLNPMTLLVWGLVLICGAAFMVCKSRWDQRFTIPMFLLLTVYPLMFIIWHADVLEIERHAFGLAIQLRLALWILSLYLVDRFFTWLSVRRIVRAGS